MKIWIEKIIKIKDREVSKTVSIDMPPLPEIQQKEEILDSKDSAILIDNSIADNAILDKLIYFIDKNSENNQITPQINGYHKNPDGSIDIFFKNDNLLPVNIVINKLKSIERA